MITLKKLVAVGIVLAATSATAFAASTPPSATATTAAPPVSGTAAPATPAATKATQPARAHHMAMSQKKVEAIQTALNNNGEKITVDGRWGHKTITAVKDFQQKHGLKATGHANKKTLEQLKIGA